MRPLPRTRGRPECPSTPARWRKCKDQLRTESVLAPDTPQTKISTPNSRTCHQTEQIIYINYKICMILKFPLHLPIISISKPSKLTYSRYLIFLNQLPSKLGSQKGTSHLQCCGQQVTWHCNRKTKDQLGISKIPKSQAIISST